MRQMGFDLDLELELAGFYPRGGGRIRAVVHPVEEVKGLSMVERGDLLQIRGISGVANLKRSIAERQRSQVLQRFGDRYYLNDLRIKNLKARYKGTVLLLLAEFEKSQACYFSLGEIGKPAERVADQAIDNLEKFIESDGAIDQYLADQLLLPMAFAKDGSELSTSKVTNHLLTNAEVLRAFLPVEIEIDGELGEPGYVRVQPG